MRKICHVLFLRFIVFSCTFTEKPSSIKTKNARAQKANLSKAIINAGALFENLNDIGGNSELNKLEVLVDDILVI